MLGDWNFSLLFRRDIVTFGARPPRPPLTAEPRDTTEAPPDGEPPTKGAEVSDATRLLVLAGAAVAALDELPEEVRGELDAAGEVFVVTPTLTSSIEWLMSDIDRARHEADERLDTILGQLEPSGARVSGGAVGDDTPMTAVEDHVRGFHPDRILLALRSPEHADWQERGLVERIRSETGLPLTVFQIDPEGHARSA